MSIIFIMSQYNGNGLSIKERHTYYLFRVPFNFVENAGQFIRNGSLNLYIGIALLEYPKICQKTGLEQAQVGRLAKQINTGYGTNLVRKLCDITDTNNLNN